MKLEVVEGNTQRLDGGAMFGNAPRQVWESWSPPDERNRISLACRALLVRTDDGRNLLLEAGIGAFFDPKMRERFGVFEGEHMLLRNLETCGVPHEAIDEVILSHLHFDHAGGVLSAFDGGEPRLLFPKARFHVGRTHWARARAPHVRDKASFVPKLNELLESSGRLVLVDDSGESDLAPLVTFRFSHGHTPGLMLARIALPGGPLLFAADLVPGLPWVHLPITMGYDRSPELLVDEKRAILSELARDGGALYFTHDSSQPCARVRVQEQGRYFGEPMALAAMLSRS